MNVRSLGRGSIAVVLSVLATCGVGACSSAPTRAGLPTAQPATSGAPTVAVVAEAPIGADRVSSPIRAIDASGADLRVTAVRASTTVQDPVATTELRVLVENPLETPADGRLLVTLPRRARATGVSVRRGEEIVALGARSAERVRLSFEDYAATAVEPLPLGAYDAGSVDALLPTLAKGEQLEVIVSYTELLGGEPLVVRLRGLPALDVLDVKVTTAGDAKPIGEASLAGARPDADLVVPVASFRAGGVEAHGLAVGADLVAVRATLPERLSDADPLVSPILLVDTSAAAALELGRALTALRALVAALPADLPIHVATFDQTVESVYEGRAGDFGDAVEGAIRARHAIGAADLEKALRWAAHEAGGSKGERRLVLFTAGHTTVGEVAGLPQAVKAFRQAGIPRRDVIAPRVGRDDARLDLVVRGDDGHGVVLDVDLDGATLARRLQRRSLGTIPIAVAGASDVFPREIDDGRAGDTITVVARVPGAGAEVKLTAGSTRFDVPVAKPTTAAPDLDAHLSAPRAPLYAPAGGGAPRASIADAVTSGRFAISDVPSTLSADAMSTDPMNGAVASSTTPVTIPEPPPEEPIAEPVAEPTEPQDQPVIPPGRIPAETIRRIVRINSGRFKSCYIDLLRRKPRTSGRIVTSFKIAADGTVSDAAIVDASSDIKDSETSDCVTTAFSKLSFPSPGSESVSITYPLRLTTDKSEAPTGSRVAPGKSTPSVPMRGPADEHIDPLYRGELGELMTQIASGDAQGALHRAWTWVNASPGEPLAYFALGHAARAASDTMTAERAFASILALWSNRPDMARFAGQQLEQLTSDSSLDLAIDAYERAVELRPDEPTSYRLLAFARLRAGHPEAAFKTIEKAIEANYGSDKFVGARATLTSDLSTIGAAWLRVHANQRRDIETGLKPSGASIETRPSLRFVVVWEQPGSASLVTRDASASPDHLEQLKTSQAHVKGAYGPDELAIRGGDRHPPYSFVLELGRMSGPMGFSMGKLEIVEHDGAGNVSFEEHPFLVMNGATRIDLGSYAP